MRTFEARTAIVCNVSFVSPYSARLKPLLGKRASVTRLLTYRSCLAAGARSVATCLGYFSLTALIVVSNFALVCYGRDRFKQVVNR
ncbi:uncharacterized protein K489DRAFT_379846, partial [Dissoconium aciculare CBS 342.82]|uniref:Uncharacterized protein n=1 Tax=Dissoconium aciculare CBS 342.82 TaxID=1314786 RepID=A0A6J3M757_9PEZI